MRQKYYSRYRKFIKKYESNMCSKMSRNVRKWWKIALLYVKNHCLEIHDSYMNGFSHKVMRFFITSKHFWTFWNTCLIHTFWWTFYIKNNIFWRIAPLMYRWSHVRCVQPIWCSASETDQYFPRYKQPMVPFSVFEKFSLSEDSASLEKLLKNFSPVTSQM